MIASLLLFCSCQDFFLLLVLVFYCDARGIQRLNFRKARSRLVLLLPEAVWPSHTVKSGYISRYLYKKEQTPKGESNLSALNNKKGTLELDSRRRLLGFAALLFIYSTYLSASRRRSPPKKPASRKAPALEEERYRPKETSGMFDVTFTVCGGSSRSAAALRTDRVSHTAARVGCYILLFIWIVSVHPRFAVARNTRRRLNVIIASQVLAAAICISAPLLRHNFQRG